MRLPRLVGYSTAVHWVASGEQQRPKAALAAGAVDAIAEPEQLRDVSLALLEELASGERDYQARRTQMTSALTLSDAELQATAAGFRSAILGKVGNHYPAPLKAVELVSNAAHLGRDEAIKMENEAFYEISQTPQARAMVGLFLSDQYIVKQAKNRSRALADKLPEIKTAGVIGAGIMGGGIAYQNAIRGYSVVMKDINQPALDLGIQEANKLLAKGVKRGKLTEEKAGQILSLDSCQALKTADVAPCNMLVEAVVELESVKKMVLPAVEALARRQRRDYVKHLDHLDQPPCRIIKAPRKLLRHALL